MQTNPAQLNLIWLRPTIVYVGFILSDPMVLYHVGLLWISARYSQIKRSGVELNWVKLAELI